MKILLNKNQKIKNGYVKTFHTERLMRQWLRNTKRIFLSYTVERFGEGKQCYALYGEEVVTK